jgi:hypothetical protein
MSVTIDKVDVFDGLEHKNSGRCRWETKEICSELAKRDVAPRDHLQGGRWGPIFYSACAQEVTRGANGKARRAKDGTPRPRPFNKREEHLYIVYSDRFLKAGVLTRR